MGRATSRREFALAYDLVTSDEYTPDTADPLFDMLCEEFVDASVDL